MKSKTSSGSLKMPDSQIHIGLEAAKKPLVKSAPDAVIKAKQGSKLKKPMTDPMAETYKPAKDENRMKATKTKNIPKRKK